MTTLYEIKCRCDNQNPLKDRSKDLSLFYVNVYKGLRDLTFSILGNKNVQIKLAYLQLFLGIIRLCEHYVRYQVNFVENKINCI